MTGHPNFSGRPGRSIIRSRYRSTVRSQYAEGPWSDSRSVTLRCLLSVYLGRESSKCKSTPVFCPSWLIRSPRATTGRGLVSHSTPSPRSLTVVPTGDTEKSGYRNMSWVVTKNVLNGEVLTSRKRQEKPWLHCKYVTLGVVAILGKSLHQEVPPSHPRTGIGVLGVLLEERPGLSEGVRGVQKELWRPTGRGFWW